MSYAAQLRAALSYEGDKMRQISRFVMALAVALTCFGVALVSGPGLASAGETHSNCVTFDNDGNIVSVTPNCSQTTNEPVPPMSSPTVDPCDTTVTGSLTVITNLNVFHVSVNGVGDIWLTNTQNGSVRFTPDIPTNPAGQGHWTGWFGGSLNNKSTVLTSTFNLSIHLSNGQTITSHEPVHMLVGPNGPGVSFDKPTVTCGG